MSTNYKAVEYTVAETVTCAGRKKRTKNSRPLTGISDDRLLILL